MRKGIKRIMIGLVVLMVIAIGVLIKLRIINKPYRWLIFNVAAGKETTYDKENDVLNYNSDEMEIKLEHIVKEKEILEMWVATIKLSSADQIKSAFAGGEFSQEIKERTSVIAKDNNAVLAIDGAAVGFNDKGVVIRDRTIYRTTFLDSPPLVIKENGDLYIYNPVSDKVEDIVESGGVNVYDYGPILIFNNTIIDNYGDWYRTNKEPRTAIGQKAPLEYVILVADGRSKKSEGISMYDVAEELQNRGCFVAYNLDGGGSSTLYFNGEVLNNPSDITGERKISDILYFTDK